VLLDAPASTAIRFVASLPRTPPLPRARLTRRGAASPLRERAGKATESEFSISGQSRGSGADGDGIDGCGFGSPDVAAHDPATGPWVQHPHPQSRAAGGSRGSICRVPCPGRLPAPSGHLTSARRGVPSPEHLRTSGRCRRANRAGARWKPSEARFRGSGLVREDRVAESDVRLTSTRRAS
jgi:hypothetical protein